MTFVYPEINHVFDINNSCVNTLVIENQKLFSSLMIDIVAQLNGEEGLAVIAENNNILRTDKYAELLDRFVPFELSKKALISKAEKILEHMAVSDENYRESMELMSDIEKWLMNISFGMNCDINFDKLSVSSIIKAAGLCFKEEYDSLAEKIIDYFELVSELEHKKLFILVNLRSYISDEEANIFIDTVLIHEYNVIMIESCEHTLLKNEKRYIVDSALCEIG